MKWSSLVKYCLWVMLILVLLQLQRHSTCLGCMEEERIALLEFKKVSCNWNDMYSDGNDHFLPSWVDERGSDCCSWERVHCNSTTGRVIQLSLSDIGENIMFYDNDTPVYEWKSNCYLNVTLFSTLKELQHLNLSYNGFAGWIKNEGFERLVGLKKLEVLDLTENNFKSISILQSLGKLKSLRTLSLQQNDLEGSIHLEEFLSIMPNLKLLDLSYNSLMASSQTNQIGSTSLVGFGMLEVLDLSSNGFDNSILPFLGTLTSLRTLSLSANYLEGSLHMEELVNLHELQTLDLSYNFFNCSSQVIQGFERLVGLRKLEVLDLTANNFKNINILQSLGELKSLTTLSLGHNNMNGSIHLEEFVSTLPNLQSLDLSYNYLNASSQTNLVGSTSLAGLGKLEVLNLKWNFFDNRIIPFLGKLTSLRTLYLRSNSLEGPLSIGELAKLHNLLSLDLGFNNLNCSSQTIQALCGTKRLQELYLVGNNFEGILPPCLKNLTSLSILDLSQNKFKGNISSSLITSLPSLAHIHLGFNDFEGTLTFRTFANNSKLELIDLTSAGNELQIEFGHSPWVPHFQLKKLSLSGCNLNKKTDAITRFFSSQYNLRVVDLSHCNLKGMFPTWLLKNHKMLSVLKLRNNSMRGHFLLPSYVHKAARDIDISENLIDGLIQENIGNIFPNIRGLNLSKNNFHGGIPSSIGYMSSLEALDLSDNNFIGEIPKHVAIGCSNLVFLGLSNNRLQGHVFPPYFTLTSLQILHLDNNSFSENILTGLSKCIKLWTLDISYNHLAGRIPSWIGNFTSLVVLNMRGNLLQGNIPIEFQIFEQLEFLDLSQNHLSGSMVSLLNSTNLGHLHLEGNGFLGLPSIAFINNSNLVTLDIRNNDLYGGLPDWMGALSGLRVLLLKQNQLNGPIPHHLCQLERIRLMDLSHNSLFGSIPQCFNNISFGRTADVESISRIKSDKWQGFSGGDIWFGAIEEIEFLTKSQSSSYRGGILNFMSGIDLSCNNLTSDIPHEIGDLNEIHALNLSHNQLTGSIPKTFSNLNQLESLDLSYNKLTGEIPPELVTLNFLAVFTVAHNNLSGKIPEMRGQFATFSSTSYEGNPFLCGPPLPKASSCSTSGESTNTFATASNHLEEYDIDIGIFITSFVASYVVCLLALATILYINTYWRRMWFHFIGECIYSCHDFLFDTYYKLCIYVHRFRLLLCKTFME